MGKTLLLHLMMQCASPIKSMALNIYWSSIVEHMYHNHGFYSSSIDTDDKLYTITYVLVLYAGCYGNVGARPCTGQCSVALLLCVS